MFRPAPKGIPAGSACACLSAISIFLACSKPEKPAGRELVPPPGPVRLETVLEGFSGQGFILKDSVSGDLNRDSLPDLLLAFTNASAPGTGPGDSVEFRPLAGLLGAGGGLYTRAFENRKALLCRTCGTGLHDPYLGMVVKKGFFSLEQSGATKGMDWKRTTTFRYADSLKAWVLHKDGMSGRRVARDPEDKAEPRSHTVIATRADFGEIPLDSFDIYALDEHYARWPASKIFPVSMGNNQSYMYGQRVHRLLKKSPRGQRPSERPAAKEGEGAIFGEYRD